MSNAVRIVTIGVLVFASAVGVLAAGMAEPEQFYEQEFGQADRFIVSAGSVDFYVWPAEGSARVEARLHEDRELFVSQAAGEARISVEGSVVMSFGSLNERVDLYVGPGAAITIDTGSGDVEIEGLEVGDLGISGASADVTLDNVQGRIRVQTGSGDVDLANVAGLESIQTSSGDVTGRDVRLEGDLTISTGSGDVDLRLDVAQSDLAFDLRTSSGDIRVNQIRTEDDLRFGEGRFTISVTSSSGDQTYTTR